MPTDPHADAYRDRAHAIMTTIYRAWAAIDPMIRHHPTARFEMSQDWYRRLRALQVVGAGEDEPSAEEMAKWVISPGDTMLDLPITEGQGDPVVVADVKPVRLADYIPGVTWTTYEEGGPMPRSHWDAAVDLGAWIKRQMVTDAQVIQMTVAGPPAANEEAHVAHQIRRRLLKLHGWDDQDRGMYCPACESEDWWPCQTVRLVILIWANREGYDPRWTPETEIS